MKRKVLFFLLAAVLLVGTVSAQNRGIRGDWPVSTVEGTLKLEKGVVAIESGNSVYFAPMLIRYTGFIDGLKEGAKVSVEGYVNRDFLHPTKVTVSGKSYDFPAYGFGYGQGGGYGYGHGGYGHRGYGHHGGNGRGGYGRGGRM